MGAWAVVLSLAAGAVSAESLRAEVKPYRGAPCLFVNGKPRPGFMGNSAANGDVTMTDGRCVVDSVGSLETRTVKTFPDDVVVEVAGRCLEARSDTDSAASLMLKTPTAWYYLCLGRNDHKNTARFWKWRPQGGKFDLIATPEWNWRIGEEHRFRLERMGDEVVGCMDGREVGRDKGTDATGEAFVCLSAYWAVAAFSGLRVTCGGQTLLEDHFHYSPDADGQPHWRHGGGAHARAYARAGIKLLTVTVAASDYWMDEGRYSFAVVDGRLRMIRRQHPETLVLVRLNLQAPGWWQRKYPAEVAIAASRTGQLSARKSPSPSSAIWRKHSAEALAALLRHWRDADVQESILGYAVLSLAGGEWCYGWGEALDDYSLPQRTGFRAWLTRKYADDAALRAAWKTDVGFDKAEVPPASLRLRAGKCGELFDPLEGRWAPDYLEYHSHAMAQSLLEIAAVLRAEARGKLVGFPYGYHVLDGFQPASYHNTGHRALAEVLASPDVDFLFSPYGYRERQPGGYCMPLIPLGSLAAHSKLYYLEDDTRTALAPVGASYGRCETVEQSVHVLWRNAACALAEFGNLWWMDWDQGWYDHPQLQQALAQMERMALESVRHDRARNAEILVVFSDESHRWFRAGERLVDPLVTRQMREIARIGAPYDACLISDLDKMRDYKLYIFADTLYASEAQRETVRRRVMQPGKTALWVYAPGLMSETDLKAENASSLTGIDLAMDATTACPLGVVITDYAHPATRGLAPDLRFGTELNLSPILWCADTRATILGHLVGTPTSTETPVKWWSLWRPGFALKTVNGANSVFCSAPQLPAALLRNLARLAGVHIYDDQGDVLFANSGFLAIHTAHAGERLIRLPRPATVTDAMTGEPVGRNVREFRATIPGQETRCWWVD